MAHRIVFATSAELGNLPNIDDQLVGEPALNTAEGKLYIKASDDKLLTFDSTENLGLSNYLPFNDTYCEDANTWLTTGYIKTRSRDNLGAATANLPTTAKSELGVLLFVAENANNGTGTQMFFPCDGDDVGLIFIRSLSFMKAHGTSNVGEWRRVATTDDIPTYTASDIGAAATNHKQAYTSIECTSYTADDNTMGVTPAAVKKAIGLFNPKAHTHTKAQITDFPTSLPADGGNAATVTGKAGTSTLAWDKETTLYTVGGNAIKAKLPETSFWGLTVKDNKVEGDLTIGDCTLHYDDTNKCLNFNFV